METVNITVRVDKKVKTDFDEFCNNVGIHLSTAVNMFFRAALRERRIPFVVSDLDENQKRQARKALGEAFEEAPRQSVINGTDKMTLKEINAVIEESRREKRKDIVAKG
jgi:DNA-damage-inducible protein J